MLAGGALAVVMVATLVVTLTPRRHAAPLAISSTTAPSAERAIAASQPVIDADVGITTRAAQISSFKAIPSALVSVTNAEGAEDSSTILPDLDDPVFVLTADFAYAVPWRDVAWLTVAREAVVVDADGSVIARFDDGRLVVTADAKVGSALALTED